MLDALIQSRGVLLDEFAARARAAAGGDSELSGLSALVLTARVRFANLMLRSVSGLETVPSAMMEEARLQKEEAERQVAERSAVVRAEAALMKVGVDAVREALPSGSALVSFIRYRQSTAGDARPARSIDADVRAWLREAREPARADLARPETEARYRRAGTRLRLRIWDPIARHVNGAAHVFVVPDGALNLVSFPSLPTGQKRYLVETGPVIDLLSTERDLIPDDTVRAGRGLLAVGGPSYGARMPALAVGGNAGAGCLAGGFQFDDLPAARDEVKEVSRLWSPRRAGGTAEESGDVAVLSGPAASKRAVLDKSRGRRVVHLATQGFFLGPDCAAAPAGTRGVGGLVGTGPRPQGLTDNPLQVSGLAFAGANRSRSRRSEQDTGILTAEEIASMDLQGVEWAVLSACDTGLGEIRAGEGVFGLRRAFQVAGEARSS